MKSPKQLTAAQLPELTKQVQTLPADEASVAFLEGGIAICCAGHVDIAYQIFLKLTEGELKIHEKSDLAALVKYFIRIICYIKEKPCPKIYSDSELSFDELKDFFEKEEGKFVRLVLCVGKRSVWSKKYPPILEKWHDIVLKKIIRLDPDCLKEFGFLLQCLALDSRYQEANQFLNFFDEFMKPQKMKYWEFQKS